MQAHNGGQDRLVGLNVVDQDRYARYRAGMTPILHRAGGFFRHDFTVDEVLRTDAPHPVNRVFVIAFPSPEVAESFFNDPGYLEVRTAYFEPAVDGATVLATYPSPNA